jgi:hypothetical protein
MSGRLALIRGFSCNLTPGDAGLISLFRKKLAPELQARQPHYAPASTKSITIHLPFIHDTGWPYLEKFI